jgi:hypothetical protein
MKHTNNNIKLIKEHDKKDIKPLTVILFRKLKNKNLWCSHFHTIDREGKFIERKA